jgi:hypothetical protein
MMVSLIYFFNTFLFVDEGSMILGDHKIDFKFTHITHIHIPTQKTNDGDVHSIEVDFNLHIVRLLYNNLDLIIITDIPEEEMSFFV